MNLMQLLKERIQKRFPKAALTLTPPRNEGGFWSLDLELGSRVLVVEWSPTTAFGVSDVRDENFWERPDENLATLEKALARIERLLTTDEPTSPPFPVLLARLRECRGLTQTQLASLMQVSQATVSGIERRKDIQLSTLKRIVEALGGAVEIFARFRDAQYRIDASALEPNEQLSALLPCSHLSFDAYRFEQLENCGELQRAVDIACQVNNRHTLLVMES